MLNNDVASRNTIEFPVAVLKNIRNQPVNRGIQNDQLAWLVSYTPKGSDELVWGKLEHMLFVIAKKNIRGWGWVSDLTAELCGSAVEE